MTDVSPYVFVSYSRADAARVRVIVQSLENAGIAVWRDRERLLAGNTYGIQIVQAIEQASVLLLFCSRNSFASKNVRNEVITAWDRGRRIYLPVWIDRPTEVPRDVAYWLAGCQWLDASGETEIEWLPALLNALEVCGVTPQAGAAAGTAANVFPLNNLRPSTQQTPDTEPLVAIESIQIAVSEQQRWAERMQTQLDVERCGLTFRLIPPGQFLMGAPLSDRRAEADEKPALPVTIRHPLYVMSAPVTCGFVRKLLTAFPGDRKWTDWYRRTEELPDGCPAVEIGLEHVMDFCAVMAQQHGLPLRLPTEAEWEYFSRAGAGGLYWWGDQFCKENVVCGSRHPEPSSVRRANAWGLLDVLGNVAEWTSSAYDSLQSGEALRAAIADTLESRYRVVRGGSYRERSGDELRLSRRLRVAADAPARHIGFRLVADAADMPDLNS
ncbi:MAG: SUMF1/EgtB/PvdO family nonheme iron enzyme [Planctomycetaceae bacterium]